MRTVPEDDGFRLNGSNEEVVDLVDCPASAVGTEAQAHQPAQGVAASASTAGGDGATASSARAGRLKTHRVADPRRTTPATASTGF